MPVPKYACQTRLTIDRAVVGAWRSTSQRANVRRFAGWSVGSGLRNAGTPGRDGLARLEEVAALEQVRLARASRVLEHELRRALGMLLPEGLDPVVGLLPLGDGRPPVAEDGGRSAPGVRWSRGIARISRTSRGTRSAAASGRVGHREPEPAEVVVLVVVAVPAAVLLRRA